jgi:hypothetical protein
LLFDPQRTDLAMCSRRFILSAAANKHLARMKVRYPTDAATRDDLVQPVADPTRPSPEHLGVDVKRRMHLDRTRDRSICADVAQASETACATRHHGDDRGLREARRGRRRSPSHTATAPRAAVVRRAA